MKTFKLSKDYTVVCDSKKTRTAFKHTANLVRNNEEIYSTKICYLNRTWERFEYQSILEKVINNCFEKREKEKYLKVIDGQCGQKDNAQFKSVSMVCALGKVLCNTQEEENKWDKRMLGTIKGIDFPEDFDNLTEKEKKRRLEGAKSILKN